MLAADLGVVEGLLAFDCEMCRAAHIYVDSFTLKLNHPSARLLLRHVFALLSFEHSFSHNNHASSLLSVLSKGTASSDTSES